MIGYDDLTFLMTHRMQHEQDRATPTFRKPRASSWKLSWPSY